VRPSNISEIQTDKRYQHTLANDIIPVESQHEIKSYVTFIVNDHRDENSPYISIGWPITWQWDWLVSKGDYAGTLPKRVSKFLWKLYGFKINSKQMAKIGNIARQNIEKDREFEFEFTNLIDWNHGDFDDEGSCYWTEKRSAKGMLESDNDLFCAIKLYRHGAGYARAWMLPTKKRDGIILFNGYGLRTITIARMLADWLGLSYQSISLYNNEERHGMLWINSGSEYIISTPAIAHNTSTINLNIYQPPSLYCNSCEDTIIEGEDEYFHVQDSIVCYSCYETQTFFCDSCEELHWTSVSNDINDSQFNYCNDCTSNHTDNCISCDTAWLENDLVTDAMEGELYCPDCAESELQNCVECDDITQNKYISSENVCMDCHEEKKDKIWCVECKIPHYRDNLSTGLYCMPCHYKIYPTYLFCPVRWSEKTRLTMLDAKVKRNFKSNELEDSLAARRYRNREDFIFSNSTANTSRLEIRINAND